jgi:methyl-CpG-binding domain protein 4
MRFVHGSRVRPIIYGFLRKYWTPEKLLNAPPEEVKDLLRPLGLQNRRTRALRMLAVRLVRGDWNVPEDLPGVGSYGAESYRIFVMGELLNEPKNKELKKYVEWARRSQPGKDQSDGQEPTRNKACPREKG